jgi:DNA primase
MKDHISRYFIDELIARADISEIIGNYISLRKAGRDYIAICPFHHEKTPSFTVSQEKQFYHCFGCGVHGNVIGFLMDYAALDFVEAVHELADRMGMEVVYDWQQGAASQTNSVTENYQPLYDILAQAARYYRQQRRGAPSARDYLKNRQLTGEVARDFGLGYAPPGWDNLLKTLGTDAEKRTYLLKAGLIKQKESGHCYDYFRHRIMFPIWDPRGQVIAFGGRTIDASSQEAKYLNSPETPLFQKNQTLYGWHLAKSAIRARKKNQSGQVIVVEGYMDVVALAQYEIKNTVATLGTATSREHLTRLFNQVSEIIFCFDGDAAGQKAAWRALEIALPLLKEGRQIRFVFLPSDMDPDTLVRQQGADAFFQQVAQAQPLSDFLLTNLIKEININHPDNWKTVEGQATWIAKAKPLFKQLPNNSYRELMLQKFRELTTLPDQQIKQLLFDSQSATPTPQTTQSPTPNNIRELSPVQQAIVYLLHQPNLSQSIKYSTAQLAQLQKKDIKLLLELIEITQQQPQIKLGTLCERWRGTEYENTIKLVLKTPLLETQLTNKIKLDKEFNGILQKIYQDYVKQRWNELMQKMAKYPLTAEEKQEIQQLCRLIAEAKK